VVTTIVVLAVLIVGIDALRSRIKLNLRTRAAPAARPRSREIIYRSPQGWRSLDTGAAEQREPEVDPTFSRIDSILGGNSRRGPRR
jgi:hypothetical protein